MGGGAILQERELFPFSVAIEGAGKLLLPVNEMHMWVMGVSVKDIFLSSLPQLSWTLLLAMENRADVKLH